MANDKALVDAIDVIVTAPYRVDIATLHTVVRSVGDDVIKHWCCVKPCQIPRLAIYLTKSLSEERGRDVFDRFSGVATFSNMVAERCPQLLPQLLAEALKEGDQCCMYQICCRLLAARLLPAGPPAELSRFLENVMRATHQFPNADLLHGLREIVATQSAQILDIVNEDVLENFIQTCKLLTKDSTSNWHEAAIVSINIASAIVDDMFFDSPGWPQRKVPMSERSNSFGDWGANMLAYFHGHKAVRFLHSIVARVMFFTSRNHNIPMLTRSRTLDIVFETLSRFRYGIKEFADENPSAVEKVWRNAAGEELDFNTRLSAFAVAFKITPEDAHLDNIEGVLEQLMAVIVSEDGPCGICFDHNASIKAKQLMDALCFLLRDDRKLSLLMMRRFIDFIVVQCLSSEKVDTERTDLLKISAAHVLLDALFESMKNKENKHVYPVISEIVSNPEVVEDRELMTQSLTSSFEPGLQVHCRGSLFCDRELLGLTNQLRHKLILLFLHGACTTEASLSSKEFTFLQDRALAYSKKAGFEKCQYPLNVDNSAFIPPPPPLSRPEGDWRQQIANIMGTVQRQSTEAVLEQVNRVCHEFESRCQTIEAPLRQAESHVAQLQDELDQTRARLDQQETTNTVLMEKLKKDEVTMDDKDLKIHALTKQIIELKDSAQQQNDKIAQLEADITSLKLKHATNINDLCTEAASTKDDLETLNKAERFSWEEQLAAEKQTVEKLRATIEWLELEKHKLLEEQKADNESHQESKEEMRREHEGELRGEAERLCGFEERERGWQQEKRELQERLQLAEEKEKKVLAALRGQEEE